MFLLTKSLKFDKISPVKEENKNKTAMSIEYGVTRLYPAADPIYLGIAHRSVWQQLVWLFHDKAAIL